MLPRGSVLSWRGSLWVSWDSDVAFPVERRGTERHRADVPVAAVEDLALLGARSIVRLSWARALDGAAEPVGRVSDGLAGLIAAAVEREAERIAVEAKWARGYTDRAVRF